MVKDPEKNGSILLTLAGVSSLFFITAAAPSIFWGIRTINTRGQSIFLEIRPFQNVKF
jgi:hypothetical protein